MIDNLSAEEKIKQRIRKFVVDNQIYLNPDTGDESVVENLLNEFFDSLDVYTDGEVMAVIEEMKFLNKNFGLDKKD